MSIDYRALLKKYMEHVREEEGVTFVDSINEPFLGDPEVPMTQDEVTELKLIEQELPRR